MAIVQIPLWYASEGGTAMDLACRVSSLAARRQLVMRAEGFDEVLGQTISNGSFNGSTGSDDGGTSEGRSGDIVTRLRACSAPSGGLAVFIVSTTGDGEVPRNMARAWRSLLKKSLPRDALKGVSFALYGLGDMGYGHKFCAAARKLDARLRQLGALPLTPRVLADEQNAAGGVLAPFGKWLESLWTELLQRHPLSPPGLVVDDSPRLEPPRVRLTVLAGLSPLPHVVEDTSTPSSLPPLPLQGNLPTPPSLHHAAAGAAIAHAAEASALYENGAFRLLGLDAPPLAAILRRNERMTAPDWRQDVRLLAFDFAEEGEVDEEGAGDSGKGTAIKRPVAWRAGDVAWILPENNATAVQAILALYELDPASKLLVAPFDSETGAVDSILGASLGSAGVVLSAWELFARVLAIEAVPRPFAFEQLALFTAPGSDERAKLLEIASPGGADLYHDYCYRERRGWWEVLCGGEFPSLRVPLDQLIGHVDGGLVPRLQPRAFSIASAPPCTGKTNESMAAMEQDRDGIDGQNRGRQDSPPAGMLELCVAVVEYKTPWKRQRRGVCSSWLAGLAPASGPLHQQVSVAPTTVPLWIQKGTFPMEAIDDLAKPLVMIGPGTGIAPMRAIAQYRRRRHRQTQAPVEAPPEVREDWLFFGCRHRTKDFLFGSELVALSDASPTGKDGRPLKFRIAFSRDERADGAIHGLDEHGARLYVTHRLRETATATAIWDALTRQGASIFVAGSAGQMPKDVNAAIKHIAMEHGALDASQADEFVRKLERRRRLCVEAYG